MSTPQSLPFQARSQSLTPIRTSNHCIVPYARSRAARDTKVRQLHLSVLVREDVRALDVAVDNTLIVEIHESFEDLRDIHCHEPFRELAKFLAYVVQGAVLAEPGAYVLVRNAARRNWKEWHECIWGSGSHSLEDDVKVFRSLLKAFVLYDIRMLKGKLSIELYKQGNLKF